MRIATAAAMIMLAGSTSACGQSRAQDGGPTVARNYQVGNFDRIEVAGPYDVDVHTGPAPSVSARGPEKILQHLVVEVKGDKLLIHPEQNRSLFGHSFNFRGKVEIAVTVPQLAAATIAGSGGVSIDEVRGDSFDGTVAGSGNLGLQTVDVQRLKLGITGSGAAKAGSGRAASAKYDIAGSGDIDARGVGTQAAAVSIAGSGSVAAHSSGTAAVTIMGSGDVDVTGGAKCSVSKMGSGSVRCG